MQDRPLITRVPSSAPRNPATGTSGCRKAKGGESVAALRPQAVHRPFFSGPSSFDNIG